MEKKRRTTAAKTAYANAYRGTDFRKHPEKYKIGIGEQGVLMAEPYKSEILPFWRFKDLKTAKKSSAKIYRLFMDYLAQKDFVGADMARKYLQMGWTRARRYANHSSGAKYDKAGKVRPQEKNALTSEKAKSAAIFFAVYQKAKSNKRYLKLRQEHQDKWNTEN